jgi:hypothetical protein
MNEVFTKLLPNKCASLDAGSLSSYISGVIGPLPGEPERSSAREPT